MSEYQYYEFRAIDRPLSQRQMNDLGNLSTRAEITPTSFVNVYNYDDFRGDPQRLMKPQRELPNGPVLIKGTNS